MIWDHVDFSSNLNTQTNFNLTEGDALGALSNSEVQSRLDSLFGVNKVELISNYHGKRFPIKLRCLICGNEWETKAQNVLYNNKTKICPSCWNKYRETLRRKHFCTYCGKEIEKYKKRYKTDQDGVFCSKFCSNMYKNKKREDIFSISTYRKRAFQYKEHKCACCGWHEDERVLEVHHIDENRNNNDLENLLILCPTCHRKLTLRLYKLNINHNGLVEL